MQKILLDPQEIAQVQSIVSELASRYDSAEDNDFLNEASLSAHELPRRLRSELLRFKHDENGDGVFVISGLPLDNVAIGPTPIHWKHRASKSATLREEMLFVLCGSLLGDPFGWATQQNGYLIHEVIPMKKYETAQLGFSSQQYLDWHIEDAFHPFRADYVGLMCLRNPGQTATVIGSVNEIALDKDMVERLFEPHFTIRPDESHLMKNMETGLQPVDGEDEDLVGSYAAIDRMDKAPERIPILFGDPKSPYVRLDPYFMEPADDGGARQAVDTLVGEIEKRLRNLVLEPGEILFIDNFRVVHGRVPFVAKYDGTDRWLKRINITRDLRKSREARRSSLSRQIF